MYSYIRTMPEYERAYYREMAKRCEWRAATGKDRYYMQCSIKEPLIGFPGYLNAFFVKLPARVGKLYRHSDSDLQRPCTYVSYNVVVQNNPRCISSWWDPVSGEEMSVVLEEGKVYLTDRTVEHQSWNRGDDDRIHLIVEMPA